jgi:protease-4
MDREMESRCEELGAMRRVRRAIERQATGKEIRGASARIQEKRCAAQHFGLWCCEPLWLTEAIAAVKAGAWPRVRVEMSEYDTDDPGEQKGLYSIHEGIAVVRITGQMMKRSSSYGGASTIRFKQALRAANKSDKVKGILIVLDTPGGTAAGTSDASREVRKIALESKKPIHAFCEDLCASAGYWVASQAERIVATETTEVGSIGTVAVVSDYSKKAEMEGVRVHVVSTGEHKGAFAPGAPILKTHLEALQEEVNDLNSHFMKAISRGRRRKISEVKQWATGRCWIASKALKMGLIDGVGSFDDAIKSLHKAIKAANEPIDSVKKRSVEIDKKIDAARKN